MHETPTPVAEAPSAKPALRKGEALESRRAHQYLARPGDRARHVFLLVDGWAARYRLLSDGRRQITGLFVPGDFCDLAWRHAKTLAQHVIALTPIRAFRIDIGKLEQQIECDPGARSIVDDEAYRAWENQCEWLVSLGRRTAMERLAYLFCELVQRVGRVNAQGAGMCQMPLTQVDIADIAGLTPVHVNRTLQQMRRSGLIELKSKQLRLPDFAQLRKIALFQPSPETGRLRNNVSTAFRLVEGSGESTARIDEGDRLVFA